MTYDFAEGEDRKRRAVSGRLGPVTHIEDELHVRELLDDIIDEVLDTTTPANGGHSHLILVEIHKTYVFLIIALVVINMINTCAIWAKVYNGS